MAGIVDLFNKPTGSEDQIKAVQVAKDVIIYSEAVATIFSILALGLLPAENAPTIIQDYAIQLIAAGFLAFGWLEPRLVRLQKLRSGK